MPKGDKHTGDKLQASQFLGTSMAIKFTADITPLTTLVSSTGEFQALQGYANAIPFISSSSCSQPATSELSKSNKCWKAAGTKSIQGLELITGLTLSHRVKHLCRDYWGKGKGVPTSKDFNGPELKPG